MSVDFMYRIQLGIASFFSVVYWTATGLFFSIVGTILWPLLPRKQSKQAGQYFLQKTLRGFVCLLRWFGIVECEFRGFEKLDRQEGGMIVAPNHPAIWDAIFVLAELSELTCILKASLMKNPLLSCGAALAGFIPNKPVHKMIKQSIDVLKCGGRLLLFPEGTRTRKDEGRLNMCSGGIALVAKHSGVPVWPVYIETNSDYGVKGSPIWRWPKAKVKIRMTVGEPLMFGDGEDSHVFLERLKTTYLAAMDVL